MVAKLPGIKWEASGGTSMRRDTRIDAVAPGRKHRECKQGCVLPAAGTADHVGKGDLNDELRKIASRPGNAATGQLNIRCFTRYTR